MAGNEKYLNNYIEILTTTMTDCVIRNVSMQANLKILEETVGELTKRNVELSKTIADLNDTISKNENQEIKTLNIKLSEHETKINELTSENGLLNKMKWDYESVKTKANSVDTFRNELVKERDLRKKDIEKIAELTLEIETLKSPTKKKKTVKPQVVAVEEEQQVIVSEDTIKDGGSF